MSSFMKLTTYVSLHKVDYLCLSSKCWLCMSSFIKLTMNVAFDRKLPVSSFVKLTTHVSIQRFQLHFTLCDMSHSHVWHICDLTHPREWLDFWTWLIHMCNIYVTWLISMCDMADSYVKMRQSTERLQSHFTFCDMTYSRLIILCVIYVWHDPFIYVPWLMLMCDMTRAHV